MLPPEPNCQRWPGKSHDSASSVPAAVVVSSAAPVASAAAKPVRQAPTIPQHMVEKSHAVRNHRNSRKTLPQCPRIIYPPVLVLVPVGRAQYQKLHPTANLDFSLGDLISAAVGEMSSGPSSCTHMEVAAIDVSTYSLAPPAIPTVEGDMRDFPTWKAECMRSHHGTHPGWMEAVCLDSNAAHVVNAVRKVLERFVSDTEEKPGASFHLLLVDDNTGKQHATAWACILQRLLKSRRWADTTARFNGVWMLESLCRCHGCTEPPSDYFIDVREQQLFMSQDLCTSVAAFSEFALASAFRAPLASARRLAPAP